MPAASVGAVLGVSGVKPPPPGLTKPRVLMVCACASPASFCALEPSAWSAPAGAEPRSTLHGVCASQPLKEMPQLPAISGSRATQLREGLQGLCMAKERLQEPNTYCPPWHSRAGAGPLGTGASLLIGLRLTGSGSHGAKSKATLQDIRPMLLGRVLAV